MKNTAVHGTRAMALATAALTAFVLVGCANGAAGGEAAAEAGCAPEDIQLIGQVRNETNPYEKAWLDGGDAFAESVDLEQTRLTYDGESPKQQEQLRQALSTGDPACMVLNVLPNGDSDTTPIVKEADAAGAYRDALEQAGGPQPMGRLRHVDLPHHLQRRGFGLRDRGGDVREHGRGGRHHRPAGHPRHQRSEGPLRRDSRRRSPRTRTSRSSTSRRPTSIAPRRST